MSHSADVRGAEGARVSTARATRSAWSCRSSSTRCRRYLSLTRHWWSGFTLLANAAAWDALPADIQEIVERNAEKFALLQREDIEQVNAAGAEELARQGMNVNTADTDSFRARLGAFYARWREKAGPSDLARARKLRRRDRGLSSMAETLGPLGDRVFRLDGKTALVTGAGRGIGRAVALALAAAGAELVLVSRTPSELEKLRRRDRRQGGRARPLPLDVTDSAAVRDAIAGLGRLDILVNNAGLNRPQPFLDVDEATLDRLLGLNVRAAFIVAQAAARRDGSARRRGHHQCVVADGPCRLRARPHRLRHDQARDRRADQGDGGRVGPKGVRVVSIAPTFIDTPLVRPFFDDPTSENGCSTASRSAALGTVEEVASAVVFLASPAAGLVTGSSLLVDGGWTAW